MSKFQSDLKLGQQYEKEALKLFEYDSYKISEGCFKDYDLLITTKDKKKLKVEVKADKMAKRTGNIAIEYECNNVPSGITTTRANIWIHYLVDDNKYLYFKVKELKKLIKNAKSVRGGDGCRSRMYLLKVSELNDYIKTCN